MILEGDCLEILKTLNDNSVDSIVTDPPYGWRFMGKAWDSFDIQKSKEREYQRPPRKDGKSRGQGDPSLGAGTYDFSKSANQQFQQWTEQWAKECLRVLKPGGHMLVFCGPRTYHRMASGVEDAGFEVRDQLQWLFGSGFPKSSALNRSKSGVFCQCALNKHNTANKVDLQPTGDHNNNSTDVCDDDLLHVNDPHSTDKLSNSQDDYQQCHDSNDEHVHLPLKNALKAFQQQQYAPGHSHSAEHADAEASASFGNLSSVQYKNRPANKDCSFLSESQKDVSYDKPLSKEELENKPILKDSAISVDHKQHNTSQSSYGTALPSCDHCGKPNIDGWYNGGLKPANEPILLARKPLSEKTVAANVLKHGTGGINIDASRIEGVPRTTHKDGNKITKSQGMFTMEDSGFIPPTAAGRFPANLILDEEAAQMLDEGSGGASRFFYCAKTSKSERNVGCASNHHPTVKPKKLMSYLINMITPPGGLVLDPFAGSGSTGVAAIENGFQFIGIEREKDYIQIAERRLDEARTQRTYHQDRLATL